MFIKNFHYFLIFFMIFGGLIGIFWNQDRTKKLIALGIMQAAIIILYISLGYIENATPPIFEQSTNMQNPLPHVLMLTAIVVGVSINSLGLTIIAKIKKIS